MALTCQVYSFFRSYFNCHLRVMTSRLLMVRKIIHVYIRWRHNNDVIIQKISPRVQNKISNIMYILIILDLEN